MNSENFEFKYNSVDDLFNFITGNDTCTYLQNIKTNSYNKAKYFSKKKSSKKSKKCFTEFKSVSSKTISNFSAKVYLDFNLSDWKRNVSQKEKITFLGDVEEIKRDIKKGSVFNSMKIIPNFTDGWIQTITKLSKSNI